MKLISFITAVLIISSPVFSKRLSPKPVPDVIYGNLIISADNTTGSIGAINIKDMRNNLVRWKIIYTVTSNDKQEKDVQDIYITKMALRGHYLFIYNEKGYIYKLDLKNIDAPAARDLPVITK